MTLALVFLTAFARNESEEHPRNLVFFFLGAVGVIGALAGLGVGSITNDFLLPYGLLLALLSLGYLWAFLGLRGIDDDLGNLVSRGVGLLGGLVFLIALGRSLLPPLFHSWGWMQTRPTPYLVPAGLVLMGLGLLYMGLAVGMRSENRIVVITRRELESFFYSPIVYVLLLAFTLPAGYQNYYFICMIEPPSNPMLEARP